MFFERNRGLRRAGSVAARVAAVSLTTGVAALGFAMANPGTALAATPATVKLGTSDTFGSSIIYDGGTGNANNLRIVAEGFKWAVTDVVPISATGGCVSVTPTKALCDKVFSGRDVLRVHVQLGDLADLASVEGRFSGNVFGEAGDDFMIAGQGDVGGHSRLIYNGGLGFDSVSYRRSPVAVKVTMDDQNNDGLIGSFGTTSGDNIRDDVEQVFGSESGDQFFGDDKPNRFSGFGGNDTIDPGTNVDRVDGGAGNDTFRLQDGFVDFAVGGLGTDTATTKDSFDSLTTIP